MKRTILVNGGSRGIGAAIVRLFAKSGARVVFTYLHSEDAALALASETGALAVKADSRLHDDVRRAVEKATEEAPIDVLVNCAAKAEFSLFTDLTDEAWHDMMACNLDGYYYYCREVLPQMISRKTGRIINISSMWGQVGASCEVHYSTAKAAVIGMTKALAKEVGPSGITVNCVAPGMIDTEMNRSIDAAAVDAIREETPLCRIGTTEDVARAVLYLAGEGGDFMTGQVISPNGGLVM